jgi:AcrR family transcriptional regulator
MPRTPDPSIRQGLREQAVDYVLRKGVTDLSLRPLAAALKTDARMLIYHFGSRQGLMHAILEGLREREDGQIEAWFRSGRRPRTIAEFVRWYWRRLSSPQARPAALLVFELYALALRSPKRYRGVLEDPLAYWRKLVSRSGIAPKSDDEATATLLLAATRGLLLDLSATGDRKRVNRAMAELLRMVEGTECGGSGN